MGSQLQLKSIFYIMVLCTMSMLFYVGNFISVEVEQERGNDYKFNYNEGNTSTVKNRLVDLKRKTHLQMMCQLYANASSIFDNNAFNKSKLDHILVDTKHRLLYCYVPKVACTNWKRMLMILTEKANTTNALDIPASVAHGKDVFPRLSTYSWSEIQYFLNTYKKFLFVRHPFERLLSAYRNKLEQHYLSSKYFQVRFGRYIVRHYRRTPSKEALLKGDDVTFEEFVTYLTSVKDAFNEHWMPVYNLCEPCVVKYDVIGKYETLLDDSQHVLNLIGESHLQFPHIIKNSNTTSKLDKYYSSLPKSLIWKLYGIYLMDFKLFGYDIEHFIQR